MAAQMASLDGLLTLDATLANSIAIPRGISSHSRAGCITVHVNLRFSVVAGRRAQARLLSEGFSLNLFSYTCPPPHASYNR